MPNLDRRDAAVTEPRRWQPATWFTDPATVVATGLLDRPARVWGAAPHTAAALAWKAYSWWLVTPVARAYADGAPPPRLDAANVEVALREERPYAEFRVLDATPLAGPDVVPALRRSLLDAHLAPVVDALVSVTRIGRRTLWGSVAEAVARPLLEDGRATLAEDLLADLGLAHLVTVVDGAFAVRRTCCQAVAVPALDVCAGCPVTQRRAPAGAIAS